MKKQTEKANKYIRNIPMSKRIVVRQKLNKIKDTLKLQDVVLTELYLLPNKIYEEKIDLFLKGRISWGELEQTAKETRGRYAEILNIGKNKK